MEGNEGALRYFTIYRDDKFYVPGHFVAVLVESVGHKPIQTQGTGFKTASAKALVSFKVAYPNDRFNQGMVVWVEADVTKMAWFGSEYHYSISNGPKFALLPEELVKMVTRE
jgi:hypothetical protein